MIDWSRVEELHSEIGAEDFGEIVALFMAEVDGAVEVLEKCSSDPRVVEEQMHFLKGASLNLGFEALSTLCARGETSAAVGDVGAVPPFRVRECLEESRKQFLSEYDKLFAA